jgi:prolyl oligopeptidase
VATTDYPNATRLDLIETIHGHEVSDPYRWLEDADSEQTREWSAAQAALFAQHRTEWSTREHWEKRLSEFLSSGMISAPYWRGDRQFFMRRTAGQEHAILFTVDPDGTERVLVNVMQIDPAGTTTLDSWQPSKEGDLLAYQISVGGSEEASLYVMNVASGEIVDGPIDRARYSPVAWLVGGQAFYYVRRLDPSLLPDDEHQYHRRVYLHRLGEPTNTDIEIFGAGLKITNYYGVSVSRDGRWLEITTHEGTAPRNELYWADLSEGAPEAPDLRRIFADIDAQAGFSVGRDGRLYVSTDWNAPRGRLCVADPTNAMPDTWVDLLAEDTDAVLVGTVTLDGPELAEPLILAIRTRHTVSEMAVHRLSDGAFIKKIDLPGAGTIGAVSERPDGGPIVWFTYTDHVRQSSVFTFDARDFSVRQWATPPGAVKVPAVTSQQVQYASKDGTVVRMFIVSPAAAPNAPLPTILYGYGGFGISLNPQFSAEILSWVEAGGVYAVANIRGGGEEGEEWHRDGMLANKQNVFDDFESAAEWLITHGWTSRSQLAIAGGSNGGLLVGAALTQRPELYAAVVCSAPLLDMVRYELHGLGATWNVEYGSAAVAEQFEWLYAYSPYHRVHEQTAYPSVLFTVFDGDTRVDTLHARKLCAALQYATIGERPILIRAEAEVGHGARSVSKSIALKADELAFISAHTGLTLKAE